MFVTLKLMIHAPEAKVLACEVLVTCYKSVCVNMIEALVYIAQVATTVVQILDTSVWSYSKQYGLIFSPSAKACPF